MSIDFNDYTDLVECWQCNGDGQIAGCFEDCCVCGCEDDPFECCCPRKCDVCKGKGRYPTEGAA